MVRVSDKYSEGLGFESQIFSWINYSLNKEHQCEGHNCMEGVLSSHYYSIAISCGYDHPFYHTEWWYSTRQSKHQGPPQSGRAPPGSWGKPWPTGQGKNSDVHLDGSSCILVFMLSCFNTYYTSQIHLSSTKTLPNCSAYFIMRTATNL